MPVLAKLLSWMYERLTKLLARFMGVDIARSAARRAIVLALFAAFYAAIGTCISFLLSTVSGAVASGNLPAKFVMGVGMFIPSNAVAVLSCVGAVYLATILMRIKLTVVGVEWHK